VSGGGGISSRRQTCLLSSGTINSRLSPIRSLSSLLPRRCRRAPPHRRTRERRCASTRRVGASIIFRARRLAESDATERRPTMTIQLNHRAPRRLEKSNSSLPPLHPLRCYPLGKHARDFGGGALDAGRALQKETARIIMPAEVGVARTRPERRSGCPRDRSSSRAPSRRRLPRWGWEGDKSRASLRGSIDARVIGANDLSARSPARGSAAARTSVRRS